MRFSLYMLIGFDSCVRYAFDVPKRTPQEDVEAVARNNLRIQRFLDELLTWLRSTDAIRIKFNGIVYLQYVTLRPLHQVAY